MFKLAEDAYEHCGDYHLCSLQYEKDGEVLYGFDTSIGKVPYRVYIVIGDKSYPYCGDFDTKYTKLYTKDELIQIYKEHCGQSPLEKGGD